MDNTYVVFLGDHGIWLFDERKGPLHETQQYEQYFRLPFIMIGPDIQPGVIKEPSSQVDVTPTILDVLNLTPARASLGRSMLDPLTSKSRPIWMHQEHRSTLEMGICAVISLWALVVGTNTYAASPVRKVCLNTFVLRLTLTSYKTSQPLGPSNRFPPNT